MIVAMIVWPLSNRVRGSCVRVLRIVGVTFHAFTNNSQQPVQINHQHFFERAMEPQLDANTASFVGPLPNITKQHFPNPNQSSPQGKQKRKSLRFLRKKSLGTPNSSRRNSRRHDFMNTSAPFVLIRSPSSDALNPVLRSSMSCRTLEDSLHKGRSPSHGSPGSGQRISFANVNIREYERVLGDNVSDMTDGLLSSVRERKAYHSRHFIPHQLNCSPRYATGLPSPSAGDAQPSPS